MSPLSKKAIDAPPRIPKWNLVDCPQCKKLIVVHEGETLQDHYKQQHSKTGPTDYEHFRQKPKTNEFSNPKDWTSQEYTEYKEPKKCPICETPMNVEGMDKEYWDCPKCGHTEKITGSSSQPEGPGGPKSESESKKCSMCGYPMEYYDELDLEKGLWPYWQCEKCGNWEDAEANTADTPPMDLFKDCPKCGSPMDVF